MNNKIVLSVKNLNKTYNKKIHALNNLNLEVKEGEIFGLLGPNGAGKSTMIKLLTGELKPCSGEVKKHPNCRFAYDPDLNHDHI